MNNIISQLRDLERLIHGARDAAEHDQPSLAFALLSTLIDRHYSTLTALKAQCVATWRAEAAE